MKPKNATTTNGWIQGPPKRTRQGNGTRDQAAWRDPGQAQRWGEPRILNLIAVVHRSTPDEL